MPASTLANLDHCLGGLRSKYTVDGFIAGSGQRTQQSHLQIAGFLLKSVNGLVERRRGQVRLVPLDQEA